RSVSFPLWKQPAELPEALRRLLAEAPASNELAVTMTGELADCFETKAEGVKFILEAVECAAGDVSVGVYCVDGSLVSVRQAIANPLAAAASNWHALARFAARYCAADLAVAVDIGSTTSDLTPLVQGRVAAHGMNDVERLVRGELVYTGVDRTPMCAVLKECRLGDAKSPTTAEWFCTAADAYLLAGELPEEPQNCDTADGRPRTLTHAHNRVARLVGGDRTLVSLHDAVAIAEEFCDAQLELLERSLRLRFGEAIPAHWIASGAGEFLVARLARRISSHVQVTSLTELLGEAASRCAPAHALAVLAAEAAEAAGIMPTPGI
ncbi:MAG: hypothetical protein KDA61_07880, partial [Planctomycetales bacterium]|nr:hypothetical protein [Planctomycetales bacterium]